MRLHILGVGGTFMAGVARLAVELGHRVTGSDGPLYPPMSTQLESLGIEVAGYDRQALEPAPDLVIVGNAVSRGNDAVEHMLSEGLPYVSGPEWLRSHVLRGRHVVAIAGTHGKTTVSSLVTWMLERTGARPGFLVGGVLENFGSSARLGAGRPFVVEADEYDTAFFDKRSKFLHYLPRTLVINNLEFDHADIFEDLAAIERQFHHLVRTLPREALILRPAVSAAVDRVLAAGCWSRVSTFGEEPSADWRVETAGDAVRVLPPGGRAFEARTPMLGRHNAQNVLAAVAAACDAGATPDAALDALPAFASVKRRLELRGEAGGVRVYDDFAHHPGAITATIEALARQSGAGRLLAVLEPRSNTMRMGVHAEALGPALAAADRAFVLAPPDLGWDLAGALSGEAGCTVLDTTDAIVEAVAQQALAGDVVLVMSNGAFDSIHERLLEALKDRA